MASFSNVLIAALVTAIPSAASAMDPLALEETPRWSERAPLRLDFDGGTTDPEATADRAVATMPELRPAVPVLVPVALPRATRRAAAPLTWELQHNVHFRLRSHNLQADRVGDPLDDPVEPGIIARLTWRF